MTVEEHHSDQHPHEEDRQLVDLLETVLVDPNLHTDTRMRLYHDIDEILHGVHVNLHGAAGHDVHRRTLEAHGGRLPDVLASVLVDPNLHTDTRMRLHQEIAEILAQVDCDPVPTNRRPTKRW